MVMSPLFTTMRFLNISPSEQENIAMLIECDIENVSKVNYNTVIVLLFCISYGDTDMPHGTLTISSVSEH